jgi:cell wall-associated NlpC family hydrolase
VTDYTIAPPGEVILPEPGDFILCHRKGFISAVVRWFTHSRWSHAAYYVGSHHLVEALTCGVQQTDLEVYRDCEYIIVHTHLSGEDYLQASAYALSCVGQQYGWLTILGVVLYRLTPRHLFSFVANQASICSGLVANTQTRGWAHYPREPALMTPQGLALYHRVPT